MWLTNPFHSYRVKDGVGSIKLAHDRGLQRQGALIEMYLLYLGGPGDTLRRHTLRQHLVGIEFPLTCDTLSVMEDMTLQHLAFTVTHKTVRDYVFDLYDMFAYCSDSLLSVRLDPATEKRSTLELLDTLYRRITNVFPIEGDVVDIGARLPRGINGIPYGLSPEEHLKRIALHLRHFLFDVLTRPL